MLINNPLISSVNFAQIAQVRALKQFGPFVMEHSGMKHASTHYIAENNSMRAIWPISEFISRTKMTTKEETFLRLLNPYGVVEGTAPIGWDAILIKRKEQNHVG